MNKIDSLKSVTPVLNNAGWAARVRTIMGREVFIGIGAKYTMHQAQMLCDTIRRDAARHGVDAAIS